MVGQGIEEIASILGSDIDVANIYAILPTVLEGNATGIAELTQAEKIVLAQYLNLYHGFADTNRQTQANEFLQSLLMTSIGNSSQIMAFELI